MRFTTHTSRLPLLAILAAGAVALSGCGANSATPAATDEGAASSGTSKGTIGVVLPETATSARWEAFDKPFLKAAIEARDTPQTFRTRRGMCRSSRALRTG